jgi:hypothetical protein
MASNVVWLATKFALRTDRPRRLLRYQNPPINSHPARWEPNFAP